MNLLVEIERLKYQLCMALNTNLDRYTPKEQEEILAPFGIYFNDRGEYCLDGVIKGREDLIITADYDYPQFKNRDELRQLLLDRLGEQLIKAREQRDAALAEVERLKNKLIRTNWVL